ncbi:MAG: sialate O-acetylesterase [Pirellulaceae bacterium]
MLRLPQGFCRGCVPLVIAMLGLVAWSSHARADVRVPALFADHMVLQRDLANPVWGWADAGEEVVVVLGDQKKTATAGADGKWRVALDAMPAGGPHKIVIEGKNRIAIDDVLVGEVWVCSGQSNMQFPVAATRDADLTRITANYPKLRMISVPVLGTQEPQDDFKGTWQLATPDTVGGFSAVGYYFGLTLYQALGIPVGLIHDSWGGSSCDAWVPRELFEADPQYQALMDRWRAIESNPEKEENKSQLGNQHRPGNLYNGMLKPIIGYGIRGAIWYQGESNAGRAYQYRQMFPLMIRSWRDAWKQGDFSFYWVQLADFLAEPAGPCDSAWAELREAQTMTQQLPKTGQAVIIDLGEANDIHPRNKEDVGERLARLALAKDYNIDIANRSPEYKTMEKKDNKIILSFDFVGGELKPFDVNDLRGFTIAGEDRKFVVAQAKVLDSDKTKVEVWSDQVANPAAVRYAWADNPVCNLRSANGLPATPFRTDDWPGVTINSK